MKNNKKNGFTLIELVVVITLLGTLSALALPSFTSYKKQSSAEICKANREALMRDYETCAFLNKENNLGKFLAGGFPTYASDIAEYRCPDRGEYSAKGGAILCSFHNGGGGTAPEEPIIPPKKDIPFKNHEYGEPDEKFPTYVVDEEKTYKYGDIVHDNGIIYQCIKSGKKSKEGISKDCTVNNFKTEYAVWQIIGTTNEDLDFEEGKLYGIGTIVKHNGKYYMFAPYDNYSNITEILAPDVINEGMDNVLRQWLPLTNKIDENKEDNGYIKPPKRQELGSEPIAFKSSLKLENGKYYTDGKGNVYLYKGATSKKFTWIKPDGNWDMVENGLYINENASYAKDEEVWYMGHYYIAQQDIVTVGDKSMLPAKENSEYWVLA